MTPDLDWLRSSILLALAAGCDPVIAELETDSGVETDPPGECGDFPKVDPRNVDEQSLPARVEVCGEVPEGGCVAAEELQTWAFLAEALGQTSEPDFCGWYGEGVCGPNPVDGACCYVLDLSIICEGRPLRIGGAPRFAATSCTPSWRTEPVPELPAHPGAAAAWRAIALAEHASVASFARVALHLMALGAPPTLVREATRAQADEIRHAQLAFSLASALDGAPIGPGGLSLADLDLRWDAASLLVSTLTDGCWNELVAAAEAGESARRCDPALRPWLARVAEDEARHAALAYRMVAWIVQAYPDLLPLARRTVDDLRAREPEGEGAAGLSRWGLLDGVTQGRIRRAVRDRAFPDLVEVAVGGGIAAFGPPRAAVASSEAVDRTGTRESRAGWSSC